MLRLPWIAAFIGTVLRHGLTTDPDWAFNAADELYPTSFDVDPEFAATSAFDSEERSALPDQQDDSAARTASSGQGLA